jgi:hypothetical protein
VVNADQPDISIEALTRIGMTSTEALGAPCWMPVSGSTLQAGQFYWPERRPKLS